jgi:hypothetical protein
MNEDGQEGLLVFRAFSDEAMVMRRWQIGDRYQDDGYMATTMDRSFAENWVFQYHDLMALLGDADQDADPFGAVFQIEVPAGARGMFIGGAGQQELLLARGTTLEVVGFDDSNRPIFRAISDTAVIPPPEADLFSWMRDGIRPFVEPPKWDIASMVDPLAREIDPARSARLRESVDLIQRNIHRLEDEAMPLVTNVGRDAPTAGQQIIDMVNEMGRINAFGRDAVVFDEDGQSFIYNDPGVNYTVTALMAGDSRGNTITLLDEAYGEGSRAAVAGALNFTERILEGEPSLIVEWLGSTGITPGAGAALMAEAIKEAADRDLPIRLTSVEAAIPFYERLGFKPVEGLSGRYRLTAAEVEAMAAEL